MPLDQTSSPKFDFSHPINVHDVDGVCDMAVGLAAANFKSQHGSRGDAVVAQVAEFSTRAVLSGLFEKPELATPWASGEIIMLTDSLPPGVDEIAYSTVGALADDVDDGIVAPGAPPQVYVEDATSTKLQRFETIKHAFNITQEDIWKAEVSGYDKLSRMGRNLRQVHMRAVNNVIRRGNVKHKLWGISNFPGIRRRLSSVNWYSGTPADIKAEIRAAMAEFDGSATEDPAPTLMVLPVPARRYFKQAQFSLASDAKLLEEIETSFDLMIKPDYGMSSSSTVDGPMAVLLNPSPANIQVYTPLYLWMTQPRMTESGAIHIEVWTRVAGVQVRDEDLVMALEGPSWA